jgi:hypothetical protein
MQSYAFNQSLTVVGTNNNNNNNNNIAGIKLELDRKLNVFKSQVDFPSSLYFFIHMLLFNIIWLR